jgi:hypothetical protein
MNAISKMLGFVEYTISTSNEPKAAILLNMKYSYLII